jgi:hypothetical protein
MSAAESADPTPPVVTTPGGAAVIDITKRATTRAAAAARGRWQTMQNPQPPEAGGLQRSVREQFADEMEASLNSIGHTLTDDTTAAVYLHTLRLVGRLLEGAQAQDVVTEEQRRELAGLLDGMRAAPGLL